MQLWMDKAGTISHLSQLTIITHSRRLSYSQWPFKVIFEKPCICSWLVCRIFGDCYADDTRGFALAQLARIYC